MKTFSCITLAVLLLVALCSFQQQTRFPYPQIPSVITTPEGRAAFLLTHYWDEVDFSQHEVSRRDALMEQGFVDFLSVFPHAETTVLQKAIKQFLSRSLVDRSRLESLTALVEDYLYHPNSPMLNETYYELFLTELLQIRTLSLSQREKFKFQRKNIQKNRVGTQAADFTFIDEAGQKKRLYDVKAEQILLVFYDADCEECQSVLTELRTHHQLHELVNQHRWKVVKVCIEGEETDPRNTAEIWEKYAFRAMPTLYVLDSQHRVLLKDIRWEHLRTYLQSVN